MLEKIVSIHSSIKGMVLYTEEITNRANPQELLEVRDALDHILRAAKAELEHKTDANYELVNLDKALGHLCRAGYDVLDWASLVLKQKMENELKGFSMETISAVLTNYYSVIKPNILRISTEIAEIRESKDVAKLTLEEFTKYFSAVIQLREYYEEIIGKKVVLLEVQGKMNTKSRLRWIIPIVTAVVGAVVGWALFHFFG